MSLEEQLCLNLQKQFPDNDLLAMSEERRKLYDNLQREVKQLKKNLEQILQPFWQEIKNEMFDLKNQIKEKDAKIKELEAVNLTLTRNLEIVQDDLEKMKDVHENSWHNQSTRLNTLNLTFGSLLWKVSKEPNVVQCFITSNKIADLLEIINSSLKRFFEVYEDKLLDTKSEIKRYVTSFVGILSNIAANVDGRCILVNSEKGQNLIKQLLEKLPYISTNEVPLQKIFLTTFYNISINESGLSLIENERALLERIIYHIFSNNELKKISFRLLETITYKTRNQDVIDFLNSAISIDELKENNDESSFQLYQLMVEMNQNIHYENTVLN